MDLSKLPRLSKTESPPANDEGGAQPATRDLPPARVDPSLSVAGGRGPEAWISIGIGLILLFVFPHFTQWWIHVVFHTRTQPSFLPITLGDGGPEIPYPKSVFFLSDLSIAAFSYALIIEGLALVIAARQPRAVLFALVITTAAVLLNAYYLVSSFGEGFPEGFPIVSAIAVVIGGYMMWYQLQLFRELRAYRRGLALHRKTNP